MYHSIRFRLKAISYTAAPQSESLHMQARLERASGRVIVEKEWAREFGSVGFAETFQMSQLSLHCGENYTPEETSEKMSVKLLETIKANDQITMPNKSDATSPIELDKTRMLFLRNVSHWQTLGCIFYLHPHVGDFRIIFKARNRCGVKS